jgi:hypothetical protein
VTVMTLTMAGPKRARRRIPFYVVLFVVYVVPLFAADLVVHGMQTGLPRTVAKGEQSGIESPTQVLARTVEEWTALWRRHAGDREPPPVDFSREMVVGVFMGTRPNAGFSIRIVTSMEVKGVLVVRYTETIPARDAITAQVLTSPYHLVAIPKAAVTDVKFEKVP